MVTITLKHRYAGQCQEILTYLEIEAQITTKYELSVLQDRLKTLETLLPSSTNPDA